MSNVRQWLETLGLGRYAEAFEQNAVELDQIGSLSDEELKELGVGALGHRKRIRDNAPAQTVVSPSSARTAITPSRSTSEAERRQLTVMFCDLVGSTALSESMDPEEYREILASYQSVARRVIKRYDGYIARYMGDGLLVYFGYPLAHEDDAERSVRAGLELVDAVCDLEVGVDAQLAVRIGIATGLVVAGDIVGEGASEERAVLGETPNLAARLQGCADPNAVVLSDATRRLVEGRFVLEEFEPRTLKGIREPVLSYRAVEATRVSRFEAMSSRGLTSFTGRESELAILQRCWKQVVLGDGQIVLLTGEPGIGKSRMAQELRERTGARDSQVLHYQCSPYHTGSAFHPFIEQLMHAAAFKRGDSAEARRHKLESFVAQNLPAAGAAVSLLGALLSLSLDIYPPLEMPPQRQRAETIETLVAVLDCLAARAPVLMIFEDAHWSDPSSQEVMSAIIDRVPSLAVLCVVTYRPEFSPPWAGLADATAVSLERLPRWAVNQIIERVTGEQRFPEAVLAQIVDRTDGIPLYAEELTKTVLETGMPESSTDRKGPAGHPPRWSIPATLHDSLLARLDRLASAKEVAQIAACIGREFSFELLAAVSSVAPSELEVALEQLVSAELVYRQGKGQSASYTFKHALVQDAAYESLLLARRSNVHTRIAEALEMQFPEVITSEPERIAQHFTAATMLERAIPHWIAAGQRALGVSSFAESVSHLTQGLACIASIADTFEREERELEVRTILGAATMALHGWPALEARNVVRPACALLERGHGSADAFMNFWNLWLHHGCRAEHSEGLEVVSRMLRHADRRDHPVLSLIARFAAAMASLWIGDYEASQEHEREALELYDFERDKELCWRYNHDPKNNLLSWAALRTWALGFPDRARELSNEALAHARCIGYPFNLCWTLGNSSFAFAYSGDCDEAYRRIDELGRVAKDQDLLFMDAYMVPVALNYVANQAGDYQAAYDHGSRAEDIRRGVGGRFWSPITRACMAEACLHLGRPAEGVRLINETIVEMQQTGELMLAAEIYRVAGLVHQAIDRDRARTFFESAIDIARRQKTKSFELRAAMDVARLLAEQGQRQEAIDILEPVHSWFNEESDTADHEKSKALLQELT